MAPTQAADNAAQVEERLKSALWYSIGQMTDHETLSASSTTTTSNSTHNATPHFIGALTELVWAQVASAGRDLEDFARHAGRGTILTDDVLLLARRNEGLEALLRGFVEGERVGAKEKEKAAAAMTKAGARGAANGKGRGRGRGKVGR